MVTHALRPLRILISITQRIFVPIFTLFTESAKFGQIPELAAPLIRMYFLHTPYSSSIYSSWNLQWYYIHYYICNVHEWLKLLKDFQKVLRIMIKPLLKSFSILVPLAKAGPSRLLVSQNCRPIFGLTELPTDFWSHRIADQFLVSQNR